jgi:hypothetical protein
MKKKAQHIASGFSESYDRFQDVDRCFVERLPNFKVAREYDGSFHEFEIKNQGSLLRRWLRGHKYITW